MPKKKGKKNKGSNVEKKSDESLQQEKPLPIPTTSDVGDSVASNPVTQDSNSGKKKNKKDKNSNQRQEKVSDQSNQSKSMDTPSLTSTDVQILEGITDTPELSKKQRKKKGQKEPNKEEKGDDSKTSEGNLLKESDQSSSAKRVSDMPDSIDLKKGKKKPKSTFEFQAEDEEEKKESKISSKVSSRTSLGPKDVLQEIEFPSHEFVTQQGRKKRKQQKSQVESPTVEPPIQTRHISKLTKPQHYGVKQVHSESSTKQKLSQTISSASPHAENFPIIDSKDSKKQIQKTGSKTQALSEKQSGTSQRVEEFQSTAGDYLKPKTSQRVEEFRQPQSSTNDYPKPNKDDLAISMQKMKIAETVGGEDYQLAIPQRKTRSGTKGRAICIETNHLALNFRKLDRAVHYDVAITPTTPKKLFRVVMEEFRKKFYRDRYPAFDGTKNLYSSSALPFDQQISTEITICDNERPRQFEVVIKFANYVDMTPLQKFMNANPDGIHHMLTPQEVIQCLDIVLRSAPALACLPVGRSYFTIPKDQILSLGGGMEMYYGFYQSVVVGWKPFLNIDVAHKAFPMRQNVIDLILELCELRRENLLRPLQKNEHDNVDRFITTLRIRYELPGKPGSKRQYRVNGLEKSAAEAVFKPENGSEITVEKYFVKEKNIILKYPHMPCLWVGNKDRTPHILLPPEFCTVIEGQIINRRMSEKLTSAMIKQAATSTTVRKEKIMESVRQTQFNKDPCLREFGITVNEEFTKINARVLDPPALTYNSRSVIKPSQGAWRPDKFLSGVVLSQWTIVTLDRGMRGEAIEEMVKLIHSQATNLGMTVAPPQRPFTSLQPRYRKEMQELAELFTRKKSLQLLIIIIPNSGLLYSFVKQAAEIAVGCLTQCIRNRTVCRINASIIINLLQKINAKLEGTNHVLNDRVNWMKRPFMIMGADVTHPSPDAKDKPSIAAVTASYDVSAFKYNFCWRLQPPKVEIIEDLENITREQLLYFYNNTKYKPERIVFFRDGVSEGQFSYVLNTEIQAIRRACTSLQPDGTYKPKITFLVVQKRHHTRFFPINPRDASKDRNLNVPVGTCVDTEITHPTALDFCLVSHASIQGVARPTKYRVLWDDADMTEDELEQLSFYFCHMFSRCTRSVSYPAPTYYAHLAAARIMAYCETGKLNMNNLPQEQERLCIKEFIIKQRPMFFV